MSLSMTKRLRELEKSIAQLRSELEEEKIQSAQERDNRIKAEGELEQAKQRIITLTSN